MTQGKTFNVVLLTALKDEYDQVVLVGTDDGPWEESEGDEGRLQARQSFAGSDGSTVNILATWATDMGGVVSASLATSLIDKYRPDCIAMSGICAGRRGKVELGDVIFADRLWQYDSGKVVVEIDNRGKRVEVFSADPIMFGLHDLWKQRIEKLQKQRFEFENLRPVSLAYQADWLILTLLSEQAPQSHPDRKIRCPNWAGTIDFLRTRKMIGVQGLKLTRKGKAHGLELKLRFPDGLPTPPDFAIKLAPIGTGTQVVEDPGIFHRLSRLMRKVLGLEMEAFSIAAVGDLKGVPAIVAKGVVDFADEEKDDHFRDFAARASAECLIRFLQENLSRLLPQVSGSGPGGRLFYSTRSTAQTRTRTRSFLPRDISSFTGRKKQLRQLVQKVVALRSTSTPLIQSIHGMPGSGKTALAIHVGHRVAKAYPDAQLFIDLHGFTPGHSSLSAADALDALLRALNVPPSRIPAGDDERAALWRATVANRRILLVLDNALSSEQVKPLLPSSPDVCTIITSRRRLSGLEGLDPVPLDPLPPPEAILLFRRVVGSRVKGNQGDKIIARIVHLCGYLPLAIQLVANRWKHRPAWTLSNVADQLADSRRRLKSLKSDSLDVATGFQLSYAGLTKEQKRAFRLLGISPGVDIELHSASALLNCEVIDTEFVLDELFDQSLLIETERGRYNFHDLLRDYAFEKALLEEREVKRTDAIKRFVNFHLHSASAANDRLQPFGRRIELGTPPTYFRTFTSHQDALKWFKKERTNIRACLQAATENEWYLTVGQLSHLFGYFLLTTGNTYEALEVYREARVAAVNLPSPTFEALALTNIGSTHLESGEFQTAIEYFESALELWRILNDFDGEAIALNGLGFTLERTGDYRRALALLKRALRIRKKQKDTFGRAHVLNAIGAVHWRLKDYPSAMNAFEKALDLRTKLGDQYGIGRTTNNIGFTYYQLKDFVNAEELLLKALRLAENVNDRHGVAVTLNNLSYTSHGAGRYDEGLRYASKGLRVARSIGSHYQEGRALDAKARNKLSQGNNKEACKVWRLAFEMFRTAKVPEADEVQSFLQTNC